MIVVDSKNVSDRVSSVSCISIFILNARFTTLVERIKERKIFYIKRTKVTPTFERVKELGSIISVKIIQEPSCLFRTRVHTNVSKDFTS